MDPLESIHSVIGVDRALGLRVTVRKLPLMFLLGGHSPHNTNTGGGKTHLYVDVMFFPFKINKMINELI